MTTADLAQELGDIERLRLRSLVDARMEQADDLHAPDFELVHPSGGVWSKEQYLGGIASGDINYLRFDAVSPIDVMVDGNMAVLRYQSAMEIAVEGQEASQLECWHLDCYRRDDGGCWRVRWSQATAVDRG